MANVGENGSSFADLFEKLNEDSAFRETVKKGTVIAIDGNYAIVDVGLKSEGRIALSELKCGADKEIAIGDSVDVYVDQYEGKSGEIVLSKDKAVREASWEALEKMRQEKTIIEGTILSRVKGGFMVDIEKGFAFLPGSQVDLRPVKDKEADALLGTSHKFLIISMDRERGNIVLSRRAIIEEAGAEGRAKVLEKLEEGQVIDGVVKNITSYGAFVDVGGIDGLVHNSDISWQRGVHASEILEAGKPVKVKVIKFNKETGRISLGIKQLEDDPWKAVETEFPIGAVIKGKVTNVTDYGTFVELKSGVEGLVYVSEMSWKKNASPHKITSQGAEIDVKVLDIDLEKRRISLSIKQLKRNPFDVIQEEHPVGSEFEGKITNIADFGLFVKVDSDIDGLVHINDLVWKGNPDEEIKKYKKGDEVKVKVLDIDPVKERVSLGIKQLTECPFTETDLKLTKGMTVTCIISAIQDDGLSVTLPNGMVGFIKRIDLAKDRADRNLDRFAVDEKIDAKVISIDNFGKKIGLSVKALEIAEERQFLSEYGSSDSGASLGDILGSSIDLRK